jgi:hypothetical protein
MRPAVDRGRGEAPIELVRHDPTWPSQLEREQTLLQSVLAPVASLEASSPAIIAAERELPTRLRYV